MPNNFVAGSFHRKKLCSIISSIEVRFKTENGRFAFLSPFCGKGPKSIFLATPLRFNPPDGGFPWDDLRKMFTERSHGQGAKWRWNIAENFNRLSRAHERYRQTTDRQTDGRTIAYSKRERDYVSSRSLKSHKLVIFRLFGENWRSLRCYCTDWNQHLRGGWSRRRNHVCQVSWWYFQGLQFCKGSNFPFCYWFLHGPYNSALCRTAHCRPRQPHCAACDNLFVTYLFSRCDGHVSVTINF